MKKYRLLSFLLSICIVFSVIPAVHAQEMIFDTEVKAALLIEQTTGEILYSQNAAEQNYPASLTKIMTCLLALEHGKMGDMVTVNASALEGLDEAGSTAGLIVGEELSLLNLLYCVMISSANEACNVVAEHIAGSIPAFVEMMNQRAVELGCTGTHFANTHGLHDENHYSTAQDLALIVQEALTHDLFRTITNTPFYELPATNLSAERKLYTTNKIITEGGSNPYYYAKASGVKTGFTTPAGRCLISTANNGNLQLLAVIMGADTVWDEESGMYIQRNFPECINLFEYGFNNYKIETVLTKLYPVAEVPVNKAAGSDTIALAPANEIKSLVPSDFDAKEIFLDVTLYAESVDAPVEKDTPLGSVTVKLHDEILGTAELLSITSVSRSEIKHQSEETVKYAKSNWWKWLLGILIAVIVILVALIVYIKIREKQMRKRKIAARRRKLEDRRLRGDYGDR